MLSAWRFIVSSESGITPKSQTWSNVDDTNTQMGITDLVQLLWWAQPDVLCFVCVSGYVLAGMVMGSMSWCEGNNSPSVVSVVEDEERRGQATG